MNTNCPQCRGVQSYNCHLCRPRLRKDDPVSFLEFGRNLWRGTVTAVRPGEVFVRWSDGECGRFLNKYTHLLVVDQ